jgi:putative oxidoreductase
MNTSIKRFLVGGTPLPSIIAEFGVTALRVFAGLSMALAHGWPGLPPSEKFIQTVSGLGFPLPTANAWMAKLAEFIGGILLAAGLLTRLSALMIIGSMTVAAFLAHAKDPFKVKELALLYFFIALLFLCNGAGRYSIDAFLRKGK